MLRIARLVRRHPQLVALFGFASGVGSYLLVERREAAAQLIAVLMLLSWAWLVLENALHAGVLQRFGLDMPRTVMRFATQMVHQEGLFFALPFFIAATTWGDGHALFTTLLALCALTALIDPLYYNVLAPRRWLFVVFHALTLFAVLLVALPLLVHLGSEQSLIVALASALLFSLPSIATLLPEERWWRRVPLLLLLLLALAAGLWQARSWIPPAALRLVEMSVTQSIDRAARQPGPSLARIDAAELGRNGLYAWTSVRAPRGLHEQIHHVWLHDGREVDRIALDIEGGRKAGYRGWSHKLNFPNPASGAWQVRVVTDAGQLIGATRFTIGGTIESAASRQP
ncbi:MAG: DUF5924 family protein [Gammaproteobacteria bacterium]